MKVTPLSTKSIFISCAGLGMGNASRMAALMEALSEQAKQENVSLTLKVAAWGAGYNFLSEFKKDSGMNYELIKLNPYPNSKSLHKFLYAFLSNSILLKKNLKSFSPDVIILDSDYHFPAYFLSATSKIFIGQAIDVIERAIKHEYQFKNIYEKFNMFFKERLDAFYQKTISDLILVPTFQPIESKDYKNNKIKKVSLIVRSEFQKTKKETSSESNKIAVLLSGSEIEKDAFVKLASKYSVKLFSPDKDLSSFLSHSDALDEFDIIFTQGGLTSISEVIARKIFIVVFPISNHPEQVLNAIEVQKLGLGVRADLCDLNNFSSFLESTINFKKSTRGAPLNCAGATQSASIVMKYLSRPKK